MRTTLCLALFLLLIGVPLVKAVAPAMSFSSASLVLDTLIEGDSALVKFPFVNTGDDTLRILDVRTSCGCTSTLPLILAYAPGESGVVSGWFRSTEFPGQNQKTLIVTSNVPSSSTTGQTTVYRLLFSVFVKEEITFSPSAIYATGVDRNRSFDKTVFLCNRTTRPIGITRLVPDDPTALAIISQPTGTIAANDSAAFVVRVIAPYDSLQKRVFTYLQVSSSATKYPVHRIRTIVHFR